ncbi:MAG: hypothetical protein KGV59_07570 [Tenacibaculum sp.]|nr:hypothetical protein [Tenacibaculum sp.]
MNAKNQKVDAETINQQTSEVITFNFSEQKAKVRTLTENGKIYFVGSDVAKTLGYNQPHKAIKRHCRYGMKRTIPHPQNQNKEIQALTIPEGDVFRLIVNSKLPSAQKFESWVMDEVLPTLRKKGYYAMHRPVDDFIDARDIPFYTKKINNYNVRCVDINNTIWVVVNDINKSIHSSTSSNQVAKKLNAKQKLAVKVWLYGNTHPAWCTNQLGVQLILAGSRKFQDVSQLTLGL